MGVPLLKYLLLKQVVDAKNLIFQVEGYRHLSSFAEAINQIAFAVCLNKLFSHDQSGLHDCCSVFLTLFSVLLYLSTTWLEVSRAHKYKCSCRML